MDTVRHPLAQRYLFISGPLLAVPNFEITSKRRGCYYGFLLCRMLLNYKTQAGKLGWPEWLSTHLG